MRVLPRALVTGLAGALTGAACLLGVFAAHPDVTLEMDRESPPQIASGFYPVERSGETTFAWMSSRAEVVFADMDRRSSWRCSVRFRGGRSSLNPQPSVSIMVDGVTMATKVATNDYQDLDVATPVRADEPGLALSLLSSQTFTPGPADRRHLGVQVDRLSCQPASTGWALPPSRALMAAAASGAAFGVGFVLIGLTPWSAAVSTGLISLAQAVPLTADLAPYSTYVDRAPWVGLCIALVAALAAVTLARLDREPVHPLARFVIALSAGVLYLKLLVLLHPSKPVIDALFHAHRLEWVMGGRYFFTQVMPGGVQFPYAIALYVWAAPWAVLTSDHVSLLRVVVCVSDVLAGAFLYWVIVRRWGDPLVGAAAVVFFHTVPVDYWVQANANLTNAFGQSAALVTMSAAIVWPLASNRWLPVIGLTLLAAVAFLSHVSTFALLLATLMALAVLYWWRGDPSLRAPARMVVVAVAVAVVISFALYYGHFGDAYRSVLRANTEAQAATVAGTSSPPAETRPVGEPQRLPGGVVATQALPTRAVNALGLMADAIGWPIVLLAAVGAWRVWVVPADTRLALALAAWGLAGALFLVFGILAPGGVGHQRQAIEFIARTAFACSPAACILAGRGWGWAWGQGLGPRLGATALAGYAVIAAARFWTSWL